MYLFFTLSMHSHQAVCLDVSVWLPEGRRAHVFFMNGLMKNPPQYGEQDAFLLSRQRCRFYASCCSSARFLFNVRCSFDVVSLIQWWLFIAGNSWKVAVRLLGSWTLPALRRRRELREPPRGRIRGDHWRTQLHHEVRGVDVTHGWDRGRIRRSKSEIYGVRRSSETAGENKGRERVQMRSTFYPHPAYYVAWKLSRTRLCVNKWEKYL